ncbi:MAG TPA: hypothetical protein PLL72_10115, partial [Burkholderiaceae bacterium]|nr:hypothetical protein [Burkholderiaceae bacterium]
MSAEQPTSPSKARPRLALSQSQARPPLAGRGLKDRFQVRPGQAGAVILKFDAQGVVEMKNADPELMPGRLAGVAQQVLEDAQQHVGVERMFPDFLDLLGQVERFG